MDLEQAKAEYAQARAEAVACAERLKADGREDRLAGLAVVCDLGVSACFLFSVRADDYRQAAELVRLAIATAERP